MLQSRHDDYDGAVCADTARDSYTDIDSDTTAHHGETLIVATAVLEDLVDNHRHVGNDRPRGYPPSPHRFFLHGKTHIASFLGSSTL